MFKVIQDMEIKSPMKILREIRKSAVSKDISAIVLDTSAIIDLQEVCRNYKNWIEFPELRKYDEINKIFERINREARIIIPWEVEEEIKRHENIMINQYRRELEKATIEETFRYAKESGKFIGRLRQLADPEEIGLNAFLAAHEACKGNEKKYCEKPSYVDKAILETAALLSASEKGTFNKKRIQPVGVLSADYHVLAGTDLLRKEKEYAIYPLNSRTKRK